MKIPNLCKKLLVGACVYYTLVSILFLLLSGGLVGTPSFNANSLLFLPFGFSLALAGELLTSKKLSAFSRALSHYAITLLAVLFFLILPAGGGMKASSILILMLLLSILYWLIFWIVTLLRRRIKRLMSED